MTKNKKNLLVILLGSILLSISLTINYFLTGYISKWMSILIYVGLSILYFVHILGLVVNKPSFYKMTTVIYTIAIVLMLILGGIFWSGLYLEFYDKNGELKPEKIAEVIGSKPSSKLIFVLLAFLQVTFVPISSSVVTMTGVILFGAGEGFLYSLIGQMLGSILAFYLGRLLGERFVIWIVGKESFEKYRNIIKGRDKIMLFFMFLFPFFPDDLLCMFAGLTTFTGFTFTLMILFTRSIAIATATLGVELIEVILGLGGWAYLIFAIILVVVLCIFVAVWKHGDKLEYKLLSFINKILPKKFRKMFVSDEAMEVFSSNKLDLQRNEKTINNQKKEQQNQVEPTDTKEN